MWANISDRLRFREASLCIVHISSRDANIFGTLSLAVADRVRARAITSVPLRGESIACVIAVSTFARGCSIEQLSRIVGLSHSATVRLVDRLATDGFLRRDAAPDRRVVAINPTPAGERAAAAIREARAAALRELLGSLSIVERVEFSRLNEKVLAAMITADSVPVRICRLCDVDGCGHDAGRCPVTEAGRRLRAEAAGG